MPLDSTGLQATRTPGLSGDESGLSHGELSQAGRSSQAAGRPLTRDSASPGLIVGGE